MKRNVEYLPEDHPFRVFLDTGEKIIGESQPNKWWRLSARYLLGVRNSMTKYPENYPPEMRNFLGLHANNCGIS